MAKSFRSNIGEKFDSKGIENAADFLNATADVVDKPPVTNKVASQINAATPSQSKHSTVVKRSDKQKKYRYEVRVDSNLDLRIRKYLFDSREKVVPVLTQALELFLDKKGY